MSGYRVDKCNIEQTNVSSELKDINRVFVFTVQQQRPPIFWEGFTLDLGTLLLGFDYV